MTPAAGLRPQEKKKKKSRNGQNSFTELRILENLTNNRKPRLAHNY